MNTQSRRKQLSLDTTLLNVSFHYVPMTLTFDPESLFSSSQAQDEMFMACFIEIPPLNR